MECVLRCVDQTRIVFREKSVLIVLASQDVTKKRIAGLEKYVDLEAVNAMKAIF